MILNPEDLQHVKATYVHIWNTTCVMNAVQIFIVRSSIVDARAVTGIFSSIGFVSALLT